MDDINATRRIKDLLESDTRLNEINDVDVLLEEILTQARRVMRADAGSIYIVENNALTIRYAQNDTLSEKLPPGEKLTLQHFVIPIDIKTISGYCASTGQVVLVSNVYKIPPSTPYTFNRSYDDKSGYLTKSVIAAPLLANGRKILGVIQLINKINTARRISTFANDDKLLIKHYAAHTSTALQRAQMTRAILLRMMSMAEMRDPKETYGHVNRVGAYATELFERWALEHKMNPRSIRNGKDTLRMAAMLHDVGKVAISDLILKKPAQFTQKEREIMMGHTVLGARLFTKDQSDLDVAARNVALTHHENWDGSGYPGHVDPDTGKATHVNREGKPLGKREEEIPLYGRIVSVCDVYDALRSQRVYKEAWDTNQARDELQKLSGTKFDPDLIRIFLKIEASIMGLEKRYSDFATLD